MEPEIQRWLDFAQNDLDVAKHLMGSFHPTPLEIICYHCQQSAEKIIKAVYLSLGLPGGLPRKHDLSFLLEQMKNQVKIPETIFDYSDRLNIYGVVVRYPNEIQLDLHRVHQALQYADEIMAWGVESINALQLVKALDKACTDDTLTIEEAFKDIED